jgi:hypothetical protein
VKLTTHLNLLCTSTSQFSFMVWRSVKNITGWTIGVLGFDSRRGLRIFLFTTLSGVHLASFPMGTTHLHLVPKSRMRGAIPPLLQYVFIGGSLFKHRDKICGSSLWSGYAIIGATISPSKTCSTVSTPELV